MTMGVALRGGTQSTHLGARVGVEGVDVGQDLHEQDVLTTAGGDVEALGRIAHRSLTRNPASVSIAVMFSTSADRDMLCF